MTEYNHNEHCGVCHMPACACDKKRKDDESLSDWLERLGFQPISEEQRRINLENNLDYFCNHFNAKHD